MKKLFFILIIFGLTIFGLQIASREDYLAHFPSFKNETKVIFVGDMFFDRYIRQVADKKGGDFIFCDLESLLEGAHLVVGNLEGPITANSSVSLGSVVGSPHNYVFTFPTGTARLLARHNIRLMNLGNNHIGNFGEEGISSTKKYLQEAGVNYFGLGEIYRKEINGLKFSFVSYNQFGGDSAEEAAAKVKKEKDSGRIVLVYTHWGEEYSLPTAHMKLAAKMFAEAGAQAVIGSHPHVILESERISPNLSKQMETLIYYSLGNFIFDQYFNAQVSEGLVVELVFKDGGVEAIEHKVKMSKDGRTCIEPIFENFL